MGSVIFIHGTGVREASYNATWAMVSGELKAAKPLLDIRKCIWGDKCGVKLHVGASIPHYTTARAIGAPLISDENIALWATLYEDPLFELRLLASHPAETSELPPGKVAPWTRIQNAFDKLQSSAAIEALLLKAGLTPFWPKAFDDVHSSAVCTSAIQTVGASAAGLRVAIARAIVADMTLLAREASLQGSDAAEYTASVPAPDGSLRDEIVAEIVVALGGTERFAVGEWIKDQFKGVALHIATRYLERKRGAVSDATYPGAGDVLRYQVRGQAIRDFIHAEVKASSGPVILLAHSLGGIACVDLLVLEQIEKVKLLITVGSQAPFLYEIDALYSLRPNDPLPPHFPRWLNIYDQRDLLSYMGEGVFGKDRIEDFEVDNLQPFPYSHSAYWTNPEVWKKVVSSLP